MNAVIEAIRGILGTVLAALGVNAPALDGWNGYLEADYVYVAALSPGRISAIAASEGDTVAVGEVLVQIEAGAETAQVEAARAGVDQARARLENLSTGARAAEIAVLEAGLRRAEADRDLAQANLLRSAALAGKGVLSPARLDGERAALAAAQAQLDQLRAQLEVARLPARPGDRQAAEATLDQALAQELAAGQALAERQLTAPIAGRIDRRFFDLGEVAGAGAPILSIYDPDRLKAVFFVPEAARAALHPGDWLALTCDDCPPGLRARVTRLAAEPQFTPPILYSREERARLVFRAEAVLQAPAAGLSPGQPVTLEALP